jgi:ketosteroid isomerase-like protein
MTATSGDEGEGQSLTKSNALKNFDQIAVAVDWLDACRKHDLEALLALYTTDAVLECECDSAGKYEGIAAIRSYWQPRLKNLLPEAFGLNEIMPTSDGVVIEYSSFENKPVRLAFTFNEDGKIRRSRCAPCCGRSGQA